jgi:hypothetical protein
MILEDKKMTHSLRVKLISAFIALLAVSLACNAPQANPTPDIGALVAQTRTALALDAWLTATVVSPQVTEIPTQALAQTQALATTQSSLPTTAAATPTATIVVVPPANTDLGKPDWQDTFDDKRVSFYLGATDDVSFQKKDGNLMISALRPAGDQWRVAEMGALDDFYLEAQFTTGSSCSGKDSYGLILRAPDQADNIIDSGYVTTISCDGRYRFYRMDNGNFTGLINWTAHTAILKGPDQNNTLSIQAKNFLIQAFVNGVQIFEFSDSAYPSGYFGLVVRAESGSFTALVRQMAFWR